MTVCEVFSLATTYPKNKPGSPSSPPQNALVELSKSMVMMVSTSLEASNNVDGDNIELDDDILNPLTALSATDDSIFDDSQSLPRRIRRPRDWGIPTFEQQCNGIDTFDLRPDDDSDCSEGITVTLEHRRHSTGSDLWDAALVLAHALSRPGIVKWQKDNHDDTSSEQSTSKFISNVLQDMMVLELGSGTGALGLYAAKCLGARHVWLTDLRDNLELLERNRKANQFDNDVHVSIAALDWLDESLPAELQEDSVDDSRGDRSIDLILGSDLFLPFAAHLLDPLARTLRDLLQWSLKRRWEANDATTTQPKPPPQALICYEERFDVSPFWESATQYGLMIEQVDPSLLHPKYQDPEFIKLLRITVKQSN